MAILAVTIVRMLSIEEGIRTNDVAVREPLER